MRRVWWRWLAAAAATLGSGGPVHAQTVRLGPTVLVAASDPWFGGGGATVGVRVSRDVEVTGALLAGRRGEATVGRGEIGVRVYLPQRSIRVTRWYLQGGVAGVTGRDQTTGLILAGLGVERGRRNAWFGEVGVGGGVRVATGYRWQIGANRP